MAQSSCCWDVSSMQNSDCSRELGSCLAWFSSPSLVSSYPTIWLKGFSLNFRGLWPLAALKLKDAGGVKMLLLLLVWQGKSSEFRANTNNQLHAVHSLINSQRLLRVFSLPVSQAVGVFFNHGVGVAGELLWGNGEDKVCGVTVLSGSSMGYTLTSLNFPL